MDRAAPNPALGRGFGKRGAPGGAMAMPTCTLAPKAGVTLEMHTHSDVGGGKCTCQLVPYLVLAAPGPE